MHAIVKNCAVQCHDKYWKKIVLQVIVLKVRCPKIIDGGSRGAQVRILFDCLGFYVLFGLALFPSPLPLTYPASFDITDVCMLTSVLPALVLQLRCLPTVREAAWFRQYVFGM